MVIKDRKQNCNVDIAYLKSRKKEKENEIERKRKRKQEIVEERERGWRRDVHVDDYGENEQLVMLATRGGVLEENDCDASNDGIQDDAYENAVVVALENDIVY
jgi:hypothetical protein